MAQNKPKKVPKQQSDPQESKKKENELDRRTWMYVSVLVILFGIIAFAVNMMILGYKLEQAFDLAVKSHVISGIILIILGFIVTKGKKPRAYDKYEKKAETTS